MIVTVVEVHVEPEHVNAFIAAIGKNHEASVKEPGNMRFDVLQSSVNHTQFFLYEAYENEEASKAHKETPHYKSWKESVESMMARPRVGTPCKIIHPSDRAMW